MKNIILGLLLFVIAAGTFLVSKLPVQFALDQLPKNLPVTLVAPSGTVWHGSATQVIVEGTVLGRLEWDVNPMSLLGAKLNVDFKLDGNGILAKGNAEVDRSQAVLLTNTVVDAEVENLPLPPEATAFVTPAGRLNATIRQLELEQQKLTFIDADVLWNPANITAPANYQLGEVTLNLSGDKGRLHGKINSSKGQIDTKGTVDIDTKGLAKANIRIAPNATTPQDIKDLLPMVGKPDRNGVVTIKEQITVPGWAS